MKIERGKILRVQAKSTWDILPDDVPNVESYIRYIWIKRTLRAGYERPYNRDGYINHILIPLYPEGFPEGFTGSTNRTQIMESGTILFALGYESYFLSNIEKRFLKNYDWMWKQQILKKNLKIKCLIVQTYNPYGRFFYIPPIPINGIRNLAITNPIQDIVKDAEQYNKKSRRRKNKNE